MRTPKSCANCRWLSLPQLVVFGQQASEERVLCLKKHWNGSVLAFNVFKRHAERWQEKARRCKDYSPMENGKLPCEAKDGIIQA